MKKLISIMLVVCILLVSPTYVYADQESVIPLLSERTDQEIYGFLLEYGVEIPGGDMNFESWVDFVRETIAFVEENPYYSFGYGSPVLQQFAKAIQGAVNDYYNISSDAAISARSSALYNLQDSIPYGSWDNDFYNYNCYAFALGLTDDKYAPGNFIGEYYDKYTMPSLSTMVSYVRLDLKELGRSCVDVLTTEPTSIPNGATVICMRLSTSDFHFMRKYGNNWLHKPSTTHILLWRHPSPSSTTWTNEHVINGTAYRPQITYSSDIYYFVFKSNHGATINREATGENYHSGNFHYYEYLYTCADCGDSYYVYERVSCGGPPCVDMMSLPVDPLVPISIE